MTTAGRSSAMASPGDSAASRVRSILAAVRPLAAEYYALTGKPLGVTGEVAEFAAAECLGLELTVARTAGYDAVRQSPRGPIRIQIKGRALTEGTNRSQRIGRIKLDSDCDVVLLVLLDAATLEPKEMWEAPFSSVATRLAEPGSRARNERGALSVSDFKRLLGAAQVWPRTETTAQHGRKNNSHDRRARQRSFRGAWTAGAADR